jgi:hypothetical protein
MRFDRTLIALSLLAALSACTAAQDKSTETRPGQAAASSRVADPMAPFAGKVSGEGKITFSSGTSMYTTRHWGPGKHSVREMTHGEDAAGNPTRGLGVVYWHPGRKQIRLLGLDDWESGVAEGTITFEGESSESVIDLHQTRGLRKLVSRAVPAGPGKTRLTLLEATGSGGLTPMNEWISIHSDTITPVRPPPADKLPKRSKHLEPFDSLLGGTWGTTGEAKGDWASGAALSIHSTLEWIPYADGIYARTHALSKGGEPAHVLDTYFFHHTGARQLRCLALSHPGGVYEGNLTVVDGGALEAQLTGYERDQVVSYVARVDFEKDGTLRFQAWSLKGTERSLMLDVRQRKLDPK